MALMLLSPLLLGVVAQETSVFNIQIPQDLRKTNGYRHMEAQFGQISYNRMITQKLYYSNSTLCSPDAVAGGGLPRGSWTPPYILMVDRGDCTFVTKAKAAQRLGATALVVADNLCTCDDVLCTGLSASTCQAQEPIMADDGTGLAVTIPSILMVKTDADLIKEYLFCGKRTQDPTWTCPSEPPTDLYIQAQLEYSLPDPDERVEWSLWTTSVDEVATVFVESFKETAVALGSHQLFSPHFYTYNGSDYGCRKANECGNLCTNGGRYCAPDPDGAFDRGVSGADVVKENVRRTCIWQLYGSSKNLPEDDPNRGLGIPWWDYVSGFWHACGCDDCVLRGDFSSPTCVESAMLTAKIDPGPVNDCIALSGGFADDADNSILDAEIAELTKNGIYQIPECLVNTQQIVGGLDTANVLNAICEGFSDGDEPRACDCLPQVAFPAAYEDCISNLPEVPPVKSTVTSGSKKSQQSGLEWWAVVLVCLAVVFSMLVAGLFYWKTTQTHMRDQVRGILAEYMPLDGGGGGPLERGNNNPIHTPGGLSQELPTTSSSNNNGAFNSK